MVIAAAISHRSGHFEILEIIRLKAKSFGRHEVPRVAHLAVGQEPVARRRSRVRRAGYHRRRARKSLRRRLRAPNVSQVHRGPGRRALSRHSSQNEAKIPRINGRVIADHIVLPVVAQEFIKRKRGARQNVHINSHAIRVRGVAIRLMERRNRSGVCRKQARAFIAIPRIAQAQAHLRLRQQCEIVILHAPH